VAIVQGEIGAMRMNRLAMTLVFALAGCAAGPSPDAVPPAGDVSAPREPERVIPPGGTPPARPPAGVAESPAERAGEVVVSVVGTPFLLAFKTAICGATVVVAAPIAAFSALTPHGGEAIDTLGEGIAINCGPPYVLSPHAG
jgi:hypothetical protein